MQHLGTKVLVHLNILFKLEVEFLKNLPLWKVWDSDKNEWAELQAWITVVSSLSQAVGVLKMIISQKPLLKLTFLAMRGITYTTQGEAFAGLQLEPEGRVQ